MQALPLLKGSLLPRLKTFSFKKSIENRKLLNHTTSVFYCNAKNFSDELNIIIFFVKYPSPVAAVFCFEIAGRFQEVGIYSII